MSVFPFDLKKDFFLLTAELVLIDDLLDPLLDPGRLLIARSSRCCRNRSAFFSSFKWTWSEFA